MGEGKKNVARGAKPSAEGRISYQKLRHINDPETQLGWDGRHWVYEVPTPDPGEMGRAIGPERGERLAACLDMWSERGRTYEELAERVPRKDGTGHVGRTRVTAIHDRPELTPPVQAKAIADAVSELYPDADWRFVCFGVRARTPRPQ
jgi:hypothetical protein